MDKVSASASSLSFQEQVMLPSRTHLAVRPLLSHLLFPVFHTAMVPAHPFPESLQIWPRTERDAALGSGKKLEGHCQLGVELGRKYTMLALTFTFQHEAKRECAAGRGLSFNKSHPVIFRLSTSGTQTTALCACPPAPGLACQIHPLFLACLA